MSQVRQREISWPIGKRGRSVIVVEGEEDAHQLAPILIDERTDPADPNAGTVVAALPDLVAVSPDQLALECRAAGFDGVWLVVPASERARLYAFDLDNALVNAGRQTAAYAPLPAGWKLTDILAELSPQRGLLYEILITLWLAGGPPAEELKEYVKDLAKGFE